MKQDKYEKPSWIATGIAIGIWISLFVVLCVKCHAQDKTDTIPVTILVRISGRPWAFFHDGWEVRKYRMNDFSYLGGIHVCYLDSRKRPIRKEWVVYQTFKR